MKNIFQNAVEYRGRLEATHPLGIIYLGHIASSFVELRLEEVKPHISQL